MTKPTKWHVRPAKTRISLGIRPVWPESSLSAWRKLGSLPTHWAHSEDSDQTGRMPRLIWVFAGRTVILLVLSWGGSDESRHEKTCFMPYANNNDADQPAHPHSLIRAFVFRRCLDSIIAILSKSEISRHKRAGLRVAWSDAQKADFFITRLIFKSIRSRHDWISKDVSVKHNSNALKWGHELFCALALCLFVQQRKTDSDMLVYVLWLFWSLRMFWLICLPLQFRYKGSRRMKKKKKHEKSDYQPIKDSVQRVRQYSLMTSPRAGREITIVSACSQERLWSDCAGTQADFCWAHAIL